MVLAAAFAIATVTVPSWTLALVFTGCFNFLNHTYYGATFATYMTLAPVHMRGVLAAIFAVAMTMIGYGFGPPLAGVSSDLRSEEHTSELQSLVRNSYAVLCLNKKNQN